MSIKIQSTDVQLVDVNTLIPYSKKEIPFLSGYFCDSLGNIYKGDKTQKSRPGGYKNKYLRVQIKRREYYVHRLVLATFLGQCPDGHQACHNDGNPRNNKVENLRWDTPKNNSADKSVHGTSGSGEKNAMAKITDIQAREIILFYNMFSSGRLAIQYGLSPSSIVTIATGRSRVNPVFKNLYRLNSALANKRIEMARNLSNKRRSLNAK